MGSKQKAVVVYGATGYTGRLTCEQLAKLGIPFIAAGRDAQRLDALVKELRKNGADCEARAVAHRPPALRELLRGAQVVINVSGPFSLLGHAVVDAALAEGCHYLDTTGEQDFMLDVRREYGALFARQKRVMSPSTAFLWGLGSLAAEICLDTPGVEEIESVYAPPSLQTMASLQSMVRTVRRPGFSIDDGKPVDVPIGEVQMQVLPDGEKRRALRIAAGETTFLLDNPRVKRCDTWFASNDLARIVPVFALWRHLANVVPGETLDRWSDSLVARFKGTPEREEPESGRFVVVTTGRGRKHNVRVVFNGTSPYLFTGFTGAMAAQLLLDGKAKHFGYVSMAQAFGTKVVLKRLEEIGTTASIEIEPVPRKARAAVAVAH